jgi:hypothetical protein
MREAVASSLDECFDLFLAENVFTEQFDGR